MERCGQWGIKRKFLEFGGLGNNLSENTMDFDGITSCMQFYKEICRFRKNLINIKYIFHIFTEANAHFPAHTLFFHLFLQFKKKKTLYLISNSDTCSRHETMMIFAKNAHIA